MSPHDWLALLSRRIGCNYSQNIVVIELTAIGLVRNGHNLVKVYAVLKISFMHFDSSLHFV